MLTRLPRALVTAAILVTVAITVACSGSSSSTTPPTTAPAPSSASPTPPSAAQQLQQLAALGTKAAFHAAYAVRQSHPSSRATWQVWRTTSSLRVDVITRNNTTATLISTPHATFSCSRGNHHRACFRVASGSQPIPVALRLLAVRLFTSDLVGIAQHPERYGIAAATQGSVTGPTHGGTCFHLTVPEQTGGVETGSYCFNANGILTVAAYPNGNVVRLTQLSVQTPRKSVFVPYSSPTPLPK